MAYASPMGPGCRLTRWVIVAGIVAACSSDRTDLLGRSTSEPDGGFGKPCPVGTERCACGDADSCLLGLVCASGLCVRLPSSGAGGAGTGGAPAGDGGRSMTELDASANGGSAELDARIDAGGS